ncbi:MAG: hypothetical protein ACR2J6_06050 [Thermoleophilaceae bacterium]
MPDPVHPSLEPRRIWWARPRKLLAMERPGGGGRSHRPDRRRQEIDWLRDHGVRVVISTMATRHNLGEYEDLGLEWHHVPVPVTAEGGDALEEVLTLLRAELRRAGATAVHGNRHTDFVAAVCAAHLHAAEGLDPAAGLLAAGRAGLMVTLEACALVGVDPEAVGSAGLVVGSTSPDLAVTM